MQKRTPLMIFCLFMLLFAAGCASQTQKSQGPQEEGTALQDAKQQDAGAYESPRKPRGEAVQDTVDEQETPAPVQETDTTPEEPVVTLNPVAWTQVVGNGFGTRTLDTVPEMEIFKGYIYAAAVPREGGTVAQLWRSPSGDAGTWKQVTDFEPPLERVNSIHSFGMTDDGDIIWLGTGSGVDGAMIYRSTDGVHWTRINEPGFGTDGLGAAAPNMAVFKGYLYAGAGSHGKGTPGQVWRTPYTSTNPGDWELLVNFSKVDGSVDLISYFYVWKDKIYFGTNGGGQLWESSDGVKFKKNPYVNEGFGDANNFVLSSFVVFDDYFYITTTNMRGGQLWRSSDGVKWEKITGDAFGKGKAVSELRSLRVAFDKLWLTAYTELEYSDGTPVWYSDDGAHFVQYNEDGFGDEDNNGQNAVTRGFGDYQYFGGPNYDDGGQVWRVKMK